MVDLQEMACALKAHDDFVMCGHVSPDGDCLGAELALAHALRKLGKNVTCLLARDEDIDFELNFLPGIDDMIPAKQYRTRAKSFISVDVPNADRMGFDAAQIHGRALSTFTIDHHISPALMSDLNYVDATSPAAALIVWKLIPFLGVEYDADIATCCYVGLITDCGRFTYQNTTAEAFFCASEMINAGVDPSKVAAQLYENRSRASIALEKRMLERIEFINGGSCVLSYLKRSDFVETNAQKCDAECMIDILRSIRGARVACMLREQEAQVRGSLRAKDGTDVASLAARFGGGGHKAAAGFTYKGALVDACKDLAAMLAEID